MTDPIHPLKNSRRRYEKRTYTPLVVAAPEDGETTDALGRSVLAQTLMISSDEFTELTRRLRVQEGPLAAAATMQAIDQAVSASELLTAASKLAATTTADLQTVADTLSAIRTEVADALTNGLENLDAGYAIEPTRASSKKVTADIAHTQAATTKAVKAARVTVKASPANGATGSSPAAPSMTPLHLPAAALRDPLLAALSLAAAAIPQRTPTAASRNILAVALGRELATRAPDVLAWADIHAPEQLHGLVAAARPYAGSSATNTATILDAATSLWRLRLLPQLFAAALTQRPLQPIGLLHLERLEMTPLDVERGELTYSLPLAPNEKVTLAHREWSVREEQFTDFIEDQLENFSQTGVSQSTDLAMSSTTQTSHDNTLNMGQPVSSANAVSVTGTVDTTTGAGSSVNDATSQEEDKSQTRSVTATASTRTMKDHKVSFTVTTVAGTEDFTSHLIENKHIDKSMRIDYFKRVRNWRSDLYRYGARLTYDVVLPDPGAQLRSREREIQAIQDELATEFQLYLVPSDIQLNNWEQLADQYAVQLPSPPEPVRQIEATQQVAYSTPFDENTAPDGSKWLDHHRLVSLATSIPDGYQLQNLNVYASIDTWPNIPNYGGWVNAYAGQSVYLATADANGFCNISWDLDGSQVPAEGQITVVFRMQVPESGLIRLTVTVTPTEAAMEEWRLSCWAAIRGAASASNALHRSYLNDRQAALQRELGADDTIRLRRLEREAIMRAVLDWLFPGFEDANSVLSNLPSPGSLNQGQWQQVMEYGEYIKFVQTAIDWDNVVVFLYPYFWDTIWNEHEKLFLNHPDVLHREFLRAGAARVIIAIQPGFENDVVSLLDMGQLGALGDQSRFAQVIDDVQQANAAYAQTTQGGGATEDPKEPGVLIGSWTDFTPTSALDIEVTLQRVIET